MDETNSGLRLGYSGALVNITGILLSGPLGLLIVMRVHPSPAWQGPQVWAENFHTIQTLPFFCGFLLLGGYLMMAAAAHQMAEAREKGYTTLALMLTAAFAALIFFNYINQTTFLPALARDYRPEYNALISGLSFANPQSLGWAIEMWGYALLGAAPLCWAAIFRRSRTEKITAALMIANGVLSAVTAFAAAGDLNWVLTPVGLIGYSFWNALVAALSVGFWLSVRQRMRAGQAAHAAHTIHAAHKEHSAQLDKPALSTILTPSSKSDYETHHAQ